MSLIAQALTSMENVRLALKLYNITAVTASETLTANTARITFSFSHSNILQNYLSTFNEVTGTASDTVLTSVMTIDYSLATVTFSAARTGNITCAGYSYYVWDYSKDRQIERNINAASTMVSKYCNRKFISDTYTEYHSGTGNTKLLTDQFPINYITSVKVDSATLTAGVDYVTADMTYLERGFIVKENGWTWYGYETGLVKELTAPVDNIEVVYSAGYTLSSLPFDIEDATLNLVLSMYNAVDKEAQGLKSLKQGELSYTWNDQLGFSSILATLDGYKKGVI